MGDYILYTLYDSAVVIRLLLKMRGRIINYLLVDVHVSLRYLFTDVAKLKPILERYNNLFSRMFFFHDKIMKCKF